MQQKTEHICSSQDLVNIMNICNELYSNLSCLAQQSFLLFTELPSQLTVFDTDYIFEHSESYSGNVIGDCSIEGYQYCVPFHRSFELLLTENYSAFILTIDYNAVCIGSLICHANENTVFLIWFGDYCISCIFQKTSINNICPTQY